MKGRKLKFPAGKKTRPTSQKVRTAVFNIIGPKLEGAAALDLFAGTGAMGIEAISRGAASAVFVDSGREAARIIKDNIEALDLADRARLMAKKAGPAIKLLDAEGKRFDLVFIDPPYQGREGDRVMKLLASLNIIEPDALIIIEHPAGQGLAKSYGGLETFDNRRYGATGVSFYRTKEQEP